MNHAGVSHSSQAGFSLTELLIAIGVATIVFSAIIALLFGVTHLWEATAAKTARLTELDDFDVFFARDCASLLAGAGFYGDATSCVFSSLSFRDDESTELVRLNYAIGQGSVLRRCTRRIAPMETDCVEEIRRFETDCVKGFLYDVGTNLPMRITTETFSSTSSAPAQVSAIIAFPPAKSQERLYPRRAR